MQRICSLLLPLTGLILFGLVSYRSMPANPQTEDAPRKYYWWSSLRLDTDPLNENSKVPNPCGSNRNCSGADAATKAIWPGWLDRILVVSALPAFLTGAAIVVGLSTAGIDEVLTFMVFMPVLLFAWYYFVGRMLDRVINRWIYRRRQAKSVQQLKIT
ncbi:MAG TPA: hypothetical protein VIW23_03120 [Candidatus Acidoferrum sp.]